MVEVSSTCYKFKLYNKHLNEIYKTYSLLFHDIVILFMMIDESVCRKST